MSRWFWLALTGLSACTFQAATGLPVENDAALDGETEVPDGDSPVDTDEPVDPQATDDDGDGWSEDDGDCEDADDDVFPGADDECDHVDNDCDDEIDEDAAWDDPYEGGSGPYVLGAIEDNPSQAVVASLHNDSDVDAFEFSIEDSWTDDFVFTAHVSGVPTDGSYRLELVRIESYGEEAPGTVAVDIGSDMLTVSMEDSWDGSDQGGVYELRVSAISGADCAADYALTLVKE